MTYDGRLAQFAARPTPVRQLHWLVSGATVLLWFYLVLPELKGFTHLLRALSPFNIILLASSAAVLLIQSIRCRDEWGFSIEPTFQRLPLLMLLGAAIASVLARWWLDLEHLSVVGFIVSAYGLIGLFCQVQTWKRGIPFMGAFAILIFLLALEFTDLGHLARTSIAEIVEFLLEPFSITAISSEDILVLSTGIAFVDIPCSGFKNIEIGSLFFMAASLLERKQMGLRWLLVGLINLALLITANIARILVIVVLTFVMQQRTMAEILHVPLGVFGFITVCLITLQLLRAVPCPPPLSLTDSLDHHLTQLSSQTLTANIRNAALTLSLLIGLALVPHPTIGTVSPAIFNTLQWPMPMQTQTIDLSQYEQTFFTRYPGVVARKQTFQFKDISGSIIFVASPTWQAHHAPELCFSASGLEIDQMQKRSLTSHVTGRWLSLNQGRRQAAYWFQSSQRTTDHYLDRVWSEITRQEPKWTMVSILFDQPVSANSADVQAILAAVHNAIATVMT
ncbi:MAG: exosortase O [Cyanothece sp. SIO1E1]|nr:exosortase O [Cyanothece sp. SIO1E1]